MEDPMEFEDYLAYGCFIVATIIFMLIGLWAFAGLLNGC